MVTRRSVDQGQILGIDQASNQIIARCWCRVWFQHDGCRTITSQVGGPKFKDQFMIQAKELANASSLPASALRGTAMTTRSGFSPRTELWLILLSR